jgi:uncharacterized protein (DUF1015 family)
MLEVRPFEAIRYDFARLNRDLSSVLAPPYDVLDGSDKAALHSRNNHNIVAVDLPHLPPKSAGPAEVYEQSARTLARWLNDGTLTREPNPAIYAYHQRFEHAGRSYTRRMFITRLRLQPFEAGVILPHEQTFGGPKEDRLALMRATACQLSPIFGLYSDPEDRIGHGLNELVQAPPDAAGLLDGVENRIWIVRDQGVIDLVASIMAEKKVYIADGHHRYGTALMYRDWLARQRGGSLPEDHPANFVMFVLASMDDPGCLILPYCRVIEGIDLRTLLEAWEQGVENNAAAPTVPGDVLLHEGASGRETRVRFTQRDVLHRVEPNQVRPWYELDYAYLHRYLIDELLTKRLGRPPKLHYVKSEEDAKKIARDVNGVALLTNATPMVHLRAMSEAGGLMPQKSTYFHPKLATGLAMYSLD